MADKAVFYKDLSLDLIPHPVSGDVRPVVNETAIRRSISNILRTKKGERVFNIDFGTSLQKYLFSVADALTEAEINKEVYETIKRYEPRVVVTSVSSKVESEGINIVIEYYIRNTLVQDSIQTLVTRT